MLSTQTLLHSEAEDAFRSESRSTKRDLVLKSPWIGRDLVRQYGLSGGPWLIQSMGGLFVEGMKVKNKASLFSSRVFPGDLAKCSFSTCLRYTGAH